MGASAHRNADREREGLSGANLGFGLLERQLGLRGALAEWLRNGLQSRLHRFDSGRRLRLIKRVPLLGAGTAGINRAPILPPGRRVGTTAP